MQFRPCRTAPVRRGFTLLEVLLASAIGMFLLAGLYFAIESHLRLARAGRDVTEHAMLVRSLMTRLAADISSQVAPQSNAGTGSSSSSSSGSGAGGGGTTSTTVTAGGVSSSTTTTPSSSSNSSNSTTAPAGPQINTGVQGDNTRLTLLVSRWPRELSLGANTDAPPTVSDLRRVTYWVVSDNGGGLARQEVKMVTSDDENASVPPDVSDPGSYVIAPEVQNVTFSYFDGTSWQDSWDGTTLGSDGVTPIGPPVAVRISIAVRASNTGGEQRDGEQKTTTYQRVVFIPSANGTAQSADTTGQ